MGSCLLDGWWQKTLQVVLCIILMRPQGGDSGKSLLKHLLVHHFHHFHHLYPFWKIRCRPWMEQQVTSISTIRRRMYHNRLGLTHHSKVHLDILFMGINNHLSYK